MENYMKKIIYAALIMVVLFGLIQLVPYGKDHTNPTPGTEPKWDSPTTRDLAKIACFDCHSDETIWPWYSNIAPVSWLVYRDVVDGRRRLNFSEWGTRPRNAGEIIEKINEGEMPPFQYTIIHKNAILDATQKAALIAGLTATLK
jgi:mono/diheme cytochrome c family protein